jgi:hypothetical protein
MKEQITAFEFGFSVQGKRVSNVGEDLVGIFKAPATWETVERGTPVDIDTANDGYVKKTADGAKPEFMLFSRVDTALEDIHMYESIIKINETRPDEPVTILPFKSGAMIRTGLLADGYTPTVDDEVYVDGGLFTDTDPTAGSGVVVGVVKQVIDGKVRILLK